METPGVVLLKDRTATEVDDLRKQAKEIKSKIAKITGACKHDWKLVGHREMRRTPVPDVWQYAVRRSARVMCRRCGKREERELFEICPICAGTKFRVRASPHIGFFGPKQRYDSDEIENAGKNVNVYTCQGCGHMAVDASSTYLCTGDHKYELARPVTADKL